MIEVITEMSGDRLFFSFCKHLQRYIKKRLKLMMPEDKQFEKICTTTFAPMSVR